MLVPKKDVFWLEITVDDFYVDEVLQTDAHISCQTFKQVSWNAVLSKLCQVLIQIDIEYLGHYEKVLPEEETIVYLDKAVFVWLFANDAHEDFGFNLGILSFTLFIFADFDGDEATSFLDVAALQDLAKSALTANLLNDVSVQELLADMSLVRSIMLLTYV